MPEACLTNLIIADSPVHGYFAKNISLENIMSNYLYIAVGGAAGAILRYLVCGIISNYTRPDFPWGTMVVNVFGAFLIGIIWHVFEKTSLTPEMRMLFMTGVLGAFTTFSTFALETLNLFRDGETKLALFNILGSNILGLAAVYMGFNLPYLLLRK